MPASSICARDLFGDLLVAVDEQRAVVDGRRRSRRRGREPPDEPALERATLADVISLDSERVIQSPLRCRSRRRG